VLQIIPGEDNFDFHRINRDIHISTFSDFWTIKFVQFSHKFRMIITHDNMKKSEGCEYQWQQWSTPRRTYRWMWMSEHWEWEIGCRSRASRLTKIRQGACRDM
jgi:hypothetical protein